MTLEDLMIVMSGRLAYPQEGTRKDLNYFETPENTNTKSNTMRPHPTEPAPCPASARGGWGVGMCILFDFVFKI